MARFNRRCLAACLLTLVVFPHGGFSQELLGVGFGKSQSDSAAFLVDSGRHVVTVGLAGRNLNAAALDGVAVAPVKKVADSTSRLVVFKMSKSLGTAFRLADRAPDGGLLTTPDRSLGGRIESRVEMVSGKFLPFTLVKLRYDGPAPKPGTPLLDAKGAVAAIAHESVGSNGGYALPVEVLQRSLELVKDGREVQRAWLGLKLKPGAGVPRVTATVPDSPASRAGLKAGDVLIEIGGLRVADYGDAVNAFFLLKPEVATVIRIKREGVEREIKLMPAAGRR